MLADGVAMDTHEPDVTNKGIFNDDELSLVTVRKGIVRKGADNEGIFKATKMILLFNAYQKGRKTSYIGWECALADSELAVLTGCDGMQSKSDSREQIVTFEMLDWPFFPVVTALRAKRKRRASKIC